MKVLLLAGNGESPKIIYNALASHVKIDHVIVEESVSKFKLLKGRIKRLGYFKVFNQLLFQVFMMRWLQLFSRKRIAVLKNELGLITKDIPVENIQHVSSVNSKDCIDSLLNVQPDLILVVGTRIISKKVLAATNAFFINTHVGITPQYRGVHGAYWALAKNDIDNCGVTIHLVDKGIDTGGIIAQGKIHVDKRDNFITYKYLQFARAIELLKIALQKFENTGTVETINKPKTISTLYYHPTLSGYLYKRVFKGVK